MKLTATEIRDWLESAATWTGLYLAWRWRPRKQGQHHVLELHDSVSVFDSVTIEAIHAFEPTPVPGPGVVAARWLNANGLNG